MPFTALSRKEAEADLELAKTVQTVVVCKEELEQALRQIKLPLDADRFFDYLKHLLPASPQEPSYGYRQ